MADDVTREEFDDLVKRIEKLAGEVDKIRDSFEMRMLKDRVQQTHMTVEMLQAQLMGVLPAAMHGDEAQKAVAPIVKTFPVVCKRLDDAVDSIKELTATVAKLEKKVGKGK